MNNLKVSVAIPTFNPDLRLLHEAITSVVEQLENPYLEILVSDGGSKSEIPRKFRMGFPSHVKFVRNPKNLGMVGDWNQAIKNTTGNLCLLLSQDDILESGMLDAYIKQFNNLEVVGVASSRRFIDENGELLKVKRFVNDRSRIFKQNHVYSLDGAQVRRLCLRNGNIIGEPSCVMFRRDAFNQIQGYDPRFQHAADLDFNLRLASVGKIKYLQTPFLSRRLHSTNLTIENYNSGIVAKERMMIFEKYSKSLSEKEINRCKADLQSKFILDSLRYLRYRRLSKFMNSFRKALVISPKSPIYSWERFQEIITNRNMDEM